MFYWILKITSKEIVEVVSPEVRPPRGNQDHPNRSESQTGNTELNKQQSTSLNRKSFLKLMLQCILAKYPRALLVIMNVHYCTKVQKSAATKD